MAPVVTSTSSGVVGMPWLMVSIEAMAARSAGRP